MALAKDKKNEIVGELAALLETSKLTVVAQYKGMTVKSLQGLRKNAKANGTQIKVVKNRLVRKALEQNATLKDVDTSALREQLLYAFNADDEVAPAQVLNTYARQDDSLTFVGAITAEGKFLSAEEVTSLALLPSKNELIAQVIATLLSPVNDVTNALSGNLHALLDGVEAKAA